MSGLLKPRTGPENGSTSSCTQPAVVKKYSCMYTTDLQKQRKVWHDGFIRIRHVNAKVYLLSEEGHTLAESFLKFSLLNQSRKSKTTKNNSDDLLCYMKVTPEFELGEDQEIEFDPVEDSESRPSSYMARIVTLVKIETENVPLMTPLNTKAKEELHKRKIEILDQTILQLSKRPKSNQQVTSLPFGGPSSPSTPAPSSSKRKLGAGFETRPFNSPLLSRSKSSNIVAKSPMLDPFPTPIKPNQGMHELHPRPSDLKPDTHHQKINYSNKSVISKPILEPIHPSFANLDSNKCKKVEEQLSIHQDLNESNNHKIQRDGNNKNHLDQLTNPPHLPFNQSNPNITSLPDSSSSSSPNGFDRVSKKKTLKINWESYFQPAKPSSS